MAEVLHKCCNIIETIADGQKGACMAENIENPARTPELFARNMKMLFTTFKTRGFSQNDLSEHLSMDPGTLSRYMTGATTSLEEGQYIKVAQYMVAKICRSEENSLRLCNLVRLDNFDYRNLISDESLSDRVSQKLKYAMNDLDLVVSAPIQVVGRKKRAGNKKRVSGLKLRHIVIIISALAVLCILAAVLWQLMPPKVTLVVTHYSDIGERDAFVTGTVTVSRGEPSDYAVTMALVSPENGHTYAPKPSRANPSVPITPTEDRSIGNFTCVFAPGEGPDIHAQELYIYVIPATFTPNEDTTETLKISVAYQNIIR